MTLKDLLERIEIRDHTSEARYPDGNGGRDHYTLTMHIHGHGKPLNAEVDEIWIDRGMMFVDLNGESDKRYQAAQEGKER